MSIEWHQSIGKQITIEIFGYENQGVFDQIIITTIRSISIDNTYYNILVDPFYLSNEIEIDFLRLIQISKRKNNSIAIIAYDYTEDEEISSSEVKGKILKVE